MPHQSVQKFVIKSVIDKASVGEVDEDGPEAINLLATIEHILNHNFKASTSLFNSGYGTFWNFIKEATSRMDDNCISKVLAITSLKSNIAKGRAWLRLALMEKRLAEYLSHAITQLDMLRKHYTDGAIIASEEMQLLVADIIGLEAIDFSFCLRNKKVNLEGRILVDYSPYLRFQHCIEGIENDMQEIQDSKHSATASNNSSQSINASNSFPVTNLKTRTALIADSDLKRRLASLQRAFRTTSEQKGYLEQMLKKSELEMAARHVEFERLLTENAGLLRRHGSEVKQLENVILELQHDLEKTKTHNKELQGVITHLYKKANNSESNDRAASSRLDVASVYSDNLSMDELILKDDAASLKPMFGSLLSETGSLTASYDRGARRMAESAPSERSLLARSRHLVSQSDIGDTKVSELEQTMRGRTASECNQETTSRYVFNSAFEGATS